MPDIWANPTVDCQTGQIGRSTVGLAQNMRVQNHGKTAKMVKIYVRIPNKSHRGLEKGVISEISVSGHDFVRDSNVISDLFSKSVKKCQNSGNVVSGVVWYFESNSTLFVNFGQKSELANRSKYTLACQTNLPKPPILTP